MGNNKDEELIWVDKAFAEKYTEMQKDCKLDEKRAEALEDYLEGVCDESKLDFKQNLETLEDWTVNDIKKRTEIMLNRVKELFSIDKLKTKI